MRLDHAIDAFYVLSSLWGSDASRCAQRTSAVQQVVRSRMPRPAATAFIDVNVIPMDTEQILANQTVVVEAGWVTAMGPRGKVQVPTNAERVDGQGKYLIPGLADMHLHTLSANEDSSRDQQVYLFRNLADGVTTIRVVGGLSVEQLRLWTRLAAEIVSPHLYFAPQFPRTLQPDSVASFIDAAKAAGFRHLSMGAYVGSWAHLPDRRVVFDSILVVARRAGFPISAHTHGMSFDATLALGTTGGSVEHLSSLFWDSLGGIWGTAGPQPKQSVDVPMAKIPALVATVQRAGLWVTPTLECIDQRHHFVKGIPRIVKAMHDAGVQLLLSADDGLDVHTELAAFVRAGLTPYQALLTGTRNVAKYFGISDSAGTAAVGKRADFVLLSHNPLADIRHTREPAGVMIAGRWFDRAALDQRLLAPGTKAWLRSAMTKRGIDSDNIAVHKDKLVALADSLEGSKPSDTVVYEGLLRRIAKELEAVRAKLTPAQREMFDPLARVWLRAQNRQGHHVVVAGIALTS